MSRELWLSLQDLNLGSDRQPRHLSSEAHRIRHLNHRFSLVVQGINPPHQNPAGMRVLLPRAWHLEGRLTSRINEDDTVQFFFRHEHQLLTVLEHAPWSYREWMVVIDRWTRRLYPDYLQFIPFWVQIHHLPDDLREDRAIREIGSEIGHVDEVSIQKPSRLQPGEVWIHVSVNAYGRLIFARYFYLEAQAEPTLLRFTYDQLRRFCTICGGLTHEADRCMLPQQPRV